MSIKYLSHTADISIEVEAKTIQELFLLGLKGMGNILKTDCCDKTLQDDKSSITINVQSNDFTNLLIDFLSEVLSESYINNTIYCDFNSIEISDYRIKAELIGTHVESFDEEIKAVTYHEANVFLDKENKLWKTSIIFDI